MRQLWNRCKKPLTLLTLILLICLAGSGITAWKVIPHYHQQAHAKSRILAESLSTAARLPLFADDRATLALQATQCAAHCSDICSVAILDRKGNVVAVAGNMQGQEPGRSICQELPVMSNALDVAGADFMGEPHEGEMPLGRVRIVLVEPELNEFVTDLIATSLLTALLLWVVVCWCMRSHVNWLRIFSNDDMN